MCSLKMAKYVITLINILINQNTKAQDLAEDQ